MKKISLAIIFLAFLSSCLQEDKKVEEPFVIVQETNQLGNGEYKNFLSDYNVLRKKLGIEELSSEWVIDTTTSHIVGQVFFVNSKLDSFLTMGLPCYGKKWITIKDGKWLIEEDEYYSGRKGTVDWGNDDTVQDYQYIRVEYLINNDSISSRKYSVINYSLDKCFRTEEDLKKMANSFKDHKYLNICDGKIFN